MNTVTFLGFTFDLNPVAFTLPIGDGWEVYWYGIVIAVGFLLAFIYAMKTAPKFGLNSDKIVDGVIISVPIAILCARAYYLLFYSPDRFFSDFFNIHDGGLAIYGGIIGGIIGALISCKVRKFNFIDTLDLMAPGFLIGQGIGRWGNFFNQEAFGVNTDLPWGMFSKGYSGTYEHIVAMGNAGLDPTKPVHPCFLYEFIWCAAGFIILHFAIVKNRKFRGQSVLFYGMWYGFGRMLIEGIRTDSLMLGSLRISQVLSGAAVLACAVLYAVLHNKNKQKTDRESYDPLFEGEVGDNVTFTLKDVMEDGSNIEDEDGWES